MKLLKMECGCSYQYSPDTFARGERVFECAHKTTWRIRAVPVETTYVSERVE